jgi:low affinity Fe/Cu permease
MNAGRTSEIQICAGELRGSVVKEYDWIIVMLTALAVLVIPAIVVLIRGVVKWTRAEERLSDLVDKVAVIAIEKEKAHSEVLTLISHNKANDGETHRELLEQMRIDREATDHRLRFIEEFWMQQGQRTIKIEPRTGG